jgi:hypothetical protein
MPTKQKRASRTRITAATAPADLKAAYRKAVRRFLVPRHPKSNSRLISPEPTHNVVGVGIGFKKVGKTHRTTLCIIFYVRKKFPKSGRLRPKKSRFLPEKIGKFPTDVVECGTPRFSAAPGGMIVVPEGAMDNAGTLGAVVEDATGRRYLLSNNHVLANLNQNPIGHPILDADTNTQIATLSAFVRLATGPSDSNDVDAAIAKLDHPEAIDSAISAPAGPLSSNSPTAAVLGSEVCKIGASSPGSFTTGTVRSPIASKRVEDENGDSLLFTDAVVIEGEGKRFSEAGDSGSLVIDVASRQAVGLLIGTADDGFSVACPIDTALKLLQNEINSTLTLCL